MVLPNASWLLTLALQPGGVALDQSEDTLAVLSLGLRLADEDPGADGLVGIVAVDKVHRQRTGRADVDRAAAGREAGDREPHLVASDGQSAEPAPVHDALLAGGRHLDGLDLGGQFVGLHLQRVRVHDG